ncbi:unnamed protein product [Ranitomeya imitator]|uniref:Uncharacterized protein n=1 Tax=Ranitomeya imitator TaxID=111125 RepID=A0ABN9LE13_9NEOB|nr:unnamed protein product [Ranitomeya imitator]
MNGTSHTVPPMITSTRHHTESHRPPDTTEQPTPSQPQDTDQVPKQKPPNKARAEKTRERKQHEGERGGPLTP